MSSKTSPWVFRVGGIAIALGAGVMIGRISAPPPLPDPDVDSTSASTKSGARGAEGGQSLSERMRRKRDTEGRAAEKNVDSDLASIMEATSRLDRTQRLLAFLDRLPTDQFAGVYEEFRNSPGANLRGSERSLILQAWAERDPLGSLSFLQEKGAQDWERETAVATWAANDPQAAFAWAGSAADEGQVNNWLLGATRGIAATNPELARDYIAQLDGRTRDQAIEAVQPYVMQYGFDYATSWISGVADEGVRNRVARSMADDLANLDPLQAGQWNAAMTDTETRRDVSETVADRWARADLDAARSWVEGLPEDTKSEAAEGVARHYARQDPAAAAQWLAGLGDNPDLDGARRILIDESFRRSPQVSLDSVASISDPRAREGYYWRYVSGWARQDSAAARSWVQSNSQTLPPQLVRRFSPQ
jgi:hypothetical protein